MPANWKLASPSILLPVVSIFPKIHRTKHFSYTTELSTSIDLHENSKVQIYNYKQMV
ncbi:hypothetical protein LINPERHAP1_LOCUS21977 [Linum perenne]